MNNFPAMTEAQRQELIRHNRAKVDAITPQFLKEVSPVVKRHLQSEIDSAKILIVALTAPPAPVLRVPDGWIKCSERYPELGQEVLIRIPVCEKFNIENGKYKGDGQFLGAWCDTRGKGRPYKVTHWMPLPPPPEASNEQ